MLLYFNRSRNVAYILLQPFSQMICYHVQYSIETTAAGDSIYFWYKVELITPNAA